MAGAVILAAGSSRRMGRRGKKELLLLDRRPVLSHSVDTFLKTGLFSHILITCPAKGMDQIQEMMASYDNLYFTPGGETRQQSVYLSLQWMESRLSPNAPIFIHDGARPWITDELIHSLWNAQKNHPAVIPVEPSTQAMKQIDEQGKIVEHLKREATWAAQTPQVFQFDKILHAHQQASNSSDLFIDDSEVWSAFEGEVWTVMGDPSNRKITYQGDL